MNVVYAICVIFYVPLQVPRTGHDPVGRGSHGHLRGGLHAGHARAARAAHVGCRPAHAARPVAPRAVRARCVEFTGWLAPAGMEASLALVRWETWYSIAKHTMRAQVPAACVSACSKTMAGAQHLYP